MDSDEAALRFAAQPKCRGEHEAQPIRCSQLLARRDDQLTTRLRSPTP